MDSKLGEERTILIRLTALWALTEAGLGGLMHLFRSPFTGILVGGSAILLISLIAYISEKPLLAIPKALLVVLIIKVMVSPHSPLPAYFAVSFQGLLGAVLFTYLSSFRLAALLLGILALLQSAFQKLITLTLLFGMPLWDSLNAFFDHVLQKIGFLAEGTSAQGSLWLVGLYVTTYMIFGILIGWLAGKLPLEIRKAKERLTLPNLNDAPSSLAEKARNKKRFWQKPIFHLIGLTLLALTLIYVFVPAAKGVLAPFWLLLRVIVIIAIWYFLLAPFLMRLLQGFLQRKAAQYEKEVKTALGLLPVFRQLAQTAWRETSTIRGGRRWKELVIRTITYALLYTKKDT